MSYEIKINAFYPKTERIDYSLKNPKTNSVLDISGSIETAIRLIKDYSQKGAKIILGKNDIKNKNLLEIMLGIN